MKRLYCFFTLMLLACWAGAVPVTVSGLVTNADGTPAPDWTVFIGDPDPAGGGLAAITDAAGFYTLTVDLPAGDSTIQVWTFDQCTAQVVAAPISAGAATADFVLCNFTWSDCWVYASAQLQQGLTVQFMGEAYGMDSLATFTYVWDFGDGGSSTEQNPAHVYAAAGMYTVTLTANSPDCSAQTTIIVSVFPVQNVTVSGTVTDQNGAGVPFWVVFIEGGDPVNQTFAYTDAQGFYSVVAGVPETATTVTANTWDFCTPIGLSETAPIVNGAAQIDFQICFDSFPPAPECGAYITYSNLPGGLTYEFAANAFALDSSATFVYHWDFGDGATSTEANPVYTYAADGVYSVLLTVTTSNGCIAHACEVICTFGGGTIDTFFYGCQAMLGVNWGGQDPAGGWDPLTIQFLDLSFGVVTAWAWDFGDSTTSTEQNPIHTYAQSGLYLVTLHITTIDGCESTIQMSIYAGDDFPWTEFDCQAMFLPIPDSTANGFFFLDLSVAESPIQSYLWDFGDGAGSTESNPYHVYAQPGIYTVTLSIEADSCSSMISFELDTNNPFHAFDASGAVLGLAANTSSVAPAPALEQLRVFPNPASSELNVAFSSPKAQSAEVSVSSLSGQTLRRQTQEVAAGPNVLRIPVQDLTPGLYLLQLRTAGQVQTLKVVKE